MSKFVISETNRRIPKRDKLAIYWESFKVNPPLEWEPGATINHARGTFEQILSLRITRIPQKCIIIFGKQSLERISILDQITDTKVCVCQIEELCILHNLYGIVHQNVKECNIECCPNLVFGKLNELQCNSFLPKTIGRYYNHCDVESCMLKFQSTIDFTRNCTIDELHILGQISDPALVEQLGKIKCYTLMAKFSPGINIDPITTNPDIRICIKRK